MLTLQSAGDFQSRGRKVSVAIGMFDGVHLGHQQVIRQAVNDAQQNEGVSVVVTFDRHPNSIVAPERVPLLIYSPAQKLRALAELRADAALVIPFTREFSEQTGEEFIRQLGRQLAPLSSVSVGASFVFGRKRSGDVALLHRLGTELNFAVRGIPAVSLDGEVVSSTRIREAVRGGDFNRASQMLGREYALAGEIMRGDQLGRQLGFPTANLDVRGLLVPPHGVYAAHATLGATRHRAAVNIGMRPTVTSGQAPLHVEAHLLDFNGELYGQELELTFVAKLRDEQKFASLDELRSQIARDIQAARSRF